VTDICGNTADASRTMTEADFDITLNIGVSVTDENVCVDNTITLTASVDDPQGLVWSNGETNVASIFVTSAGNYTVTRAGEFCDELGAAEVSSGLFILPIDAEITPSCESGPAFRLSVNGSGFFAQQWNTGTNTRAIFVTDPGNYRVTLTDGCGETEELDIVVTQEEINQCIPPVVGESCLRWPNAFLPEGDNENNKTFGPESDCGRVENYELHIFNRWGAEIFTSDRLETRWDGRKNGNYVPGDVYFYWSTYSDGTSTFKDEGDVTILR
jgi:gliding motility-associated-like protein